ncbi:DUF6387 family protein [Aeromonas hydrophila]|uniref:DUF6387 family protein n=1 Tax=Aeromonas hydrophila TaxID=644 RepID=UPI003BE1F9C4
MGMYKPGYLNEEPFKIFIDPKESHAFLKKVFNAQRYQNITELTIGVLISQLAIRASLYDMFLKSSPVVDDFIETWFEMMINGELIMKQPEDRMVSIVELMRPEALIEWVNSDMGRSQNAKKLSALHGITPLSVKTIRNMAVISEEKKFADDDSFSSRFIYNTTAASFKEKYQEAAGVEVALTIQLNEYISNEEILQNLSQLLDTWRQEMNIHSSPTALKVSSNALKKIINNKYVQLLDVMIAELALGMDINDEQMIELVYPSMSIQPDSLRKTYKKNALVFKELGCFNSWERKLSQLSLWDKPVSEVLEMDF